MAIHGAAKRKHLDQEINKLKSKKLKAKSITIDEEEDEVDVHADKDHDERGTDDEYNDYEDSRSQQEMMLFERKLKEMKKHKKTKLDNSTLKFKKKVKDNEETLIRFLKQQRLEVKYDAISFSDNLSVFLGKALNSSFSELLTDPSLNLAQDGQQLHTSQISATDLPRNLIASVRSLQNTLIIAGGGLTIGEGWAQDGDLSIGALREAQQAALLKLTEVISRDAGYGGGRRREEISEMNWGSAVKRTEKGIKRLLEDVPISADNIADGE